MTLGQLQTKANSVLATLWPVIQSKQDAYFVKHGTYFGLCWSPPTAVVDGVDTDLIMDKPSRGNVLADIDFSVIPVPFQLSIERIGQNQPQNIALEGQPIVWGNNGDTYKAWIRVELPNGDIYMRNRTKDNTDSGWFKFTETL
jgi:hypothetical protein